MIVQCTHSDVIETCDTRNSTRRDDRLTHYRCIVCGDYFPLIGDTDRWEPVTIIKDGKWVFNRDVSS